MPSYRIPIKEQKGKRLGKCGTAIPTVEKAEGRREDCFSDAPQL
jgi:hypothetical protein